MKRTRLSLMVLAVFLGGAAALPAQLGTLVDPTDRAIEHLEKAHRALAAEEARTSPEAQLAYEEMTRALEALRESKALERSDPAPRTADPFAGMVSPFGPSPLMWGFGADPGGAMMGDPFEEMRRVREEMNEIMRRQLGQRAGQGDAILPEMGLRGPRADMDIQDEEDHYVVTIDLPGVGKDDIKIEARENHLQISGSREEVVEESSQRDGFLRRERRVGTFSRTVPLPGQIQPEEIEATHENGVLTITAPKKKAVEEESRIVIVK